MSGSRAAQSQTVAQQGGDDRGTFHQTHGAAQPGQDEGIAAQPGGGVHHGRRSATLQPDCPRQGLVAPAAESAPVGDRARREVGVDGAGRVRTECPQLQPFRRQNQQVGEAGRAGARGQGKRQRRGQDGGDGRVGGRFAGHREVEGRGGVQNRRGRK